MTACHLPVAPIVEAITWKQLESYHWKCCHDDDTKPCYWWGDSIERRFASTTRLEYDDALRCEFDAFVAWPHEEMEWSIGDVEELEELWWLRRAVLDQVLRYHDDDPFVDVAVAENGGSHVWLCHFYRRYNTGAESKGHPCPSSCGRP